MLVVISKQRYRPSKFNRKRQLNPLSTSLKDWQHLASAIRLRRNLCPRMLMKRREQEASNWWRLTAGFDNNRDREEA